MIGTKVPADVRILSQTNMKVDNSMLTGESKPVKLCPDSCINPDVSLLQASNIAFTSSFVVEGEGYGIGQSCLPCFKRS